MRSISYQFVTHPESQIRLHGSGHSHRGGGHTKLTLVLGRSSVVLEPAPRLTLLGPIVVSRFKIWRGWRARQKPSPSMGVVEGGPILSNPNTRVNEVSLMGTSAQTVGKWAVSFILNNLVRTKTRVTFGKSTFRVFTMILVPIVLCPMSSIVNRLRNIQSWVMYSLLRYGWM